SPRRRRPSARHSVLEAYLAPAACLGLDAGLGLVRAAEFELELNVAVPGELLQVVTLDMIRIGEADGPESLGSQPFVYLVEVVADELLLGVGGLALVRLAGVLEGGGGDAVAARGAVSRRFRAAPGRPGGDEKLLHRVLSGQLVEGVGLHDDAARLDVIGQVQVDDRYPQGGPFQGLGFVGECLDFDWA